MRKYFEATTSDKNIIKPELIKELVYLQAETIMTGKEALPLRSMDGLELKMAMPKITSFTPEEIAEGALSSYDMLEWFTTTNVMKKYQTRVMITDEAKARQQGDIQLRTSIEAAANGFALARDADIFTTIAAGAGNSATAGAHWHTMPTTSWSIQNDVASALDTMLASSYMTESDLKSINCFYPIGLFGWLAKPLGEGYMPGMTVRKYIEDQYMIRFIPTRKLTTTALLVVNSPQTAQHISYSGSDIPTSEFQRLPGVGDQFILTYYYKTFVMPEAENGTTNTRIFKITGIA